MVCVRRMGFGGGGGERGNRIEEDGGDRSARIFFTRFFHTKKKKKKNTRRKRKKKRKEMKNIYSLTKGKLHPSIPPNRVQNKLLEYLQLLLQHQQQDKNHLNKAFQTNTTNTTSKDAKTSMYNPQKTMEYREQQPKKTQLNKRDSGDSKSDKGKTYTLTYLIPENHKRSSSSPIRSARFQ